MASNPPPQVNKVLPHTDTPTIVLALTASSYYKIRLKNCTNLAPKRSDCIQLRSFSNCVDNYGVRVNSPYFSNKDEDDNVVVRDCMEYKLDKSGNDTIDFDVINDNARINVSPYFANNKMAKNRNKIALNDHFCEKFESVMEVENNEKLIESTTLFRGLRPSAFVVPDLLVKPQRSKRKRKKKQIWNDQLCGIKNLENDRLGKGGNGDGCYGKDKIEQHVDNENEERVVSKKRRNSKRTAQTDQPCEEIKTRICYEIENVLEEKSSPGVPLDLQQKANSPKWMQKNKVKHEDHKQKKTGRKLSVILMSDVGSVKGDHKQENKKRIRKEKIQNDQSYGENERVPLNFTSPKVVSPYFLKNGAHWCESSIIECLKETKKKVRKQRISKKITCKGDEELETVVKKRLRNSKKKKTVIDQCCMEQIDDNKSLSWGSQNVASDGLRIKLQTNLVHETICQKDLINQVYPKHEDDKTGKVNTIKDCANRGEGCITNAKRKRVKPLHRSKIAKTEDDEAVHGDLGGCGLMISSINKKVEKKMKKKAASGTSADKDDDLVLSMVSQKGLIHDNQDCPKTSAARVVSPYFQNVSEKFECDVERVESNCKGKKRRRLSSAVNIDFEELLSKYTYKVGSHMNRVVDNCGTEEEEEEEGSAGKYQKKGKKARSKARSLSAAEKRAEAYQIKAPDCTWRPPRSPYNLLQEDHSYDPWRVLVICILLNITTGPQVKKVLSLFFDACPNAEAAVDADELRIASLIQSLGLHRKRAAMIQRFSREYLSDNWTHVTQLHGIGKYAADAYAMFCNGKWHQVTPNDHMLNYYWNFLQNRGLDFKKR